MKRRDALAAALGCAATLGPERVGAQAPATPAGADKSKMVPLDIKPLGGERYQIGLTIVDRKAGSFVVPGRVHKKGVPLEYLATSPRSVKEYESMLEVEATGSEFNLACILIGLEADPQIPWRDFRRIPRIPGPRVHLTLAWSEGERRQRMPAAEALLNAEAGVGAAAVEWVYTGSPVTEVLPRFAADDTGTLIGFVSDANTIIESVEPIGLGAYGSVRGSTRLPPVGTSIELIVEAAKKPK